MAKELNTHFFHRFASHQQGEVSQRESVMKTCSTCPTDGCVVGTFTDMCCRYVFYPNVKLFPIGLKVLKAAHGMFPASIISFR